MQIAHFGIKKLAKTVMVCCFTIIVLDSVASERGSTYFRFDAGSIKQSNNIKSAQDFYKRSGNKKLGRDFIYSFGLGYKINKYFRTDLTFSKIDNLNYVSSVKSPKAFNTYFQNFEIKSTLLNLYYDFSFQRLIIPYIGFGIGYSIISPNTGIHNAKIQSGRIYSSEVYNKSSNNLSYALLGGLTIKANEKFEFDFNYKFQDFGKSNGVYKIKDIGGNITYKKPESFKIKANIFTLGVRYNF